MKLDTQADDPCERTGLEAASGQNSRLGVVRHRDKGHVQRKARETSGETRGSVGRSARTDLERSKGSFESSKESELLSSCVRVESAILKVSNTVRLS
jgi:hypothetical protein